MVDVGVPTFDGNTQYGPDLTMINLDNPASATFTCSKILIRCVNEDPQDMKVGSFFGSGDTWENRDVAELGVVTSGSEQEFTGLSIDFQSGDVIGMFHTTTNSQMEANTAGGQGIVFISGDQFGAGEKSGYNTSLTNDEIAIFGDDTGGGAGAVFFAQAYSI